MTLDLLNDNVSNNISETHLFFDCERCIIVCVYTADES